MARVATYAKRFAGGYRALAYPASSAEASGDCASVSSADFSNRLAELQVRPLFVKAYIKKPLAN